MQNLTRSEAIEKLNELLGEDISNLFHQKEEKASRDGSSPFLVWNRNNLAVQIEIVYDEVGTDDRYNLNEEWASK